MRTTQFLLAAFTAAAASASPTDDGDFFSALLKRQAPGTPAYECHSACGNAIIQSREAGDGVCENADFVSNYNSCLECAGPDNFDIWQHYGGTLSAVGEGCGFETEPASGSGGDDDSDDGGSSPDDGAPTETDDASPSETSPPDAEPTDDDDASDDAGDTPSDSDDGSEEPTSGDDAEPSSPSESADIPQTDAAGALKAGFVGIAVAAACAGGLLM